MVSPPRGGARLQQQALAILRGQLVEIVAGTVFVFIGLAACAIAAIRRSGVRLFLWLGIWSAMYGTGLLTRSPAVVAALPQWLQIGVPYANAMNTYLVAVLAFLAFLELTVGRLRLVLEIILVVGIGVAAAGIGWVVLGGSEGRFIQYNRIVTVSGLGHANPSTTLNVYTHIVNDHGRELAGKVEAAFGLSNVSGLLPRLRKRAS